jgi:hypothetical protein
MALISPGVEVTITDEANYAPNQLGTIPLIILATAENKSTPSGTVARGTIKANAGKLVAATSQRELITLFGTPTFYQTPAGTPLHGYELNEYGLMAAYSTLGVSNRVYAIRADIDLAQLVGTAVRPTGTPPEATYWLDLADTQWGIFEWNTGTQAFELQTPVVITSTTELTGGIPSTSVGNIGSYAVVTTNTNNPVYFKKYDGTWVLVGSSAWATANPAVTASNANPTLVNGNKIDINGTEITLSGTAVGDLVTVINTAAIAGVTARNNNGILELYVQSTAASDGVTPDGKMAIANDTGTPLAALGITAGTYAGPVVQQGAHTGVPQWKSQDTTPRPTGSVWIKTTAANSGASLDLSVYSSLTNVFNQVSAPLYANDQSANRSLDPVGGGRLIGAGSVYVQHDVLGDNTVSYKLFRRASAGVTTVTGSAVAPTFTAGNTYTVRVSAAGSSALSSTYTVTLSGTSASSFVADLLAANVPNLTAQITSAGRIAITHSQGGVIVLKNGTGTPLTAAGITTALSNVRAGTDNDVIVSNWIPLTYTASDARPSSDPLDGTLWYYNDVGDVDVMIYDGTTWRGYQNVAVDARGYDLSATDPAGVIVGASQPVTQSDGTALVSGDLWLDTSDLENYPMIRRYSTDTTSWTMIDNADQTSENGIVFADARWDTSGTVDPIVSALPAIEALLTSDYLDLDAPDAALYPRGTLLFNTRRSGYNVKRFRVNYFNAEDFEGSLPTVTNCWVTASGLRDNGSPWMGRKAQRQMVVTAMRAALDANTEIREEQQVFNLMAAPGYHELVPNLIVLKNDRKDTAFILADTPFRLAPSATAISDFNNNVGGEGLAVNDPYCALFYPSGVSNDLGGNSIVVPPTHMALRTMVRSDNISFPWFAPAGTKRGLVDNANQLGYVDADTGEFVITGLTLGIRDTLYENKINPITFLPGVGITVYGQKTRDPNAPSALDRINVARLAVYIRTNMNALAKPFVFEPNDKLTRDEIKQVVEQLMNDLVAKRALQDYIVVCDETNNTPERIDRNELYVDAAIVPVKSAEFIYIPIRIRNTGSL